MVIKEWTAAKFQKGMNRMIKKEWNWKQFEKGMNEMVKKTKEQNKKKPTKKNLSDIGFVTRDSYEGDIFKYLNEVSDAVRLFSTPLGVGIVGVNKVGNWEIKWVDRKHIVIM